jgi:hypothetical protein
MFIDNLSKLISTITPKQIMMGVLFLGVISFLYYSFIFEGFSNEEGCRLTKTGSKIARDTIVELEKKNTKLSKDQINIGYNIRDMQSRDIILGDDSKSWCTKDVQDKLDPKISQVNNTELYLFDGPGLMDMHEKESLDAGIAYAGANDIDAQLAPI